MLPKTLVIMLLGIITLKLKGDINIENNLQL